MTSDSSLAPPAALRVGPIHLSFGAPVVMGILNVTPDSFSDGGTLGSVDDAVRRAEALVEAGAVIVDVGGESTRPGAPHVDVDTELRRVLPVLEALVARKLPAAISIDTYKAVVAQASLQRGAVIVNDVSALRDPDMGAVAAAGGAVVILMHMRGEPRTMQQNPYYTDVVQEVAASLARTAAQARACGISPSRIWLDPGIGFGKTQEHNLSLIKHLDCIAKSGHAVVLGASRKAFLGQICGAAEATERDAATAAICSAGLLYGAHIFRVHNPLAVRDALRVAHALKNVR